MTSPSDPKNRRRSERVMLQMKVTVIAEDTERKPRQEEALTLVFDAPNPKFWPVVFPPADWDAPRA